eukprot:9189852-Heterocapsa_arctica.AAC.1
MDQSGFRGIRDFALFLLACLPGFASRKYHSNPELHLPHPTLTAAPESPLIGPIPQPGVPPGAA